MTPLKSIRAYCLECCRGALSEVKLCPSLKCPLWPFRSDHNPARAGIGGKGFLPNKPNSTSDFEAQNEDQREGNIS